MKPNSLFQYSKIRSSFTRATIIFSILALTGCAATNMLISPYDKITIQTSKDVNPDGSGRPSPIQVKIYQLSSRTTLDNLDFDKLFYRGSDFLSDELLHQSDFILQPNEELKNEIMLVSGVSYIAVIAAYRDIDSSRWKQIYKIKDTGYYTHKLKVTQAGLVDIPRSQKNSRSR